MGTPARASTRKVILATSGSTWWLHSKSLSVSKTWSTATPRVMPDSAQRKPRIIRSLSSALSPIDCGVRTLRSKVAVLRGSAPCPMAAERTWYSSSPSCRLRSWEEIATGAGGGGGGGLPPPPLAGGGGGGEAPPRAPPRGGAHRGVPRGGGRGPPPPPPAPPPPPPPAGGGAEGGGGGPGAGGGGGVRG